MSDGIAIPATTTPAVQDKRPAGKPEGAESADRGEDFASVLEAVAGAATGEAAATADPAAATAGAGLPPAAAPAVVAPVAEADAPAGAPRAELAMSLRASAERGARPAPAVTGAGAAKGQPAAMIGAAAAAVTGTTAGSTTDPRIADAESPDAAPAARETAEPATLGLAAAPAARTGLPAGGPEASVTAASTAAATGSAPGPDPAGAHAVPRERPAPLTIDTRLPVHHPEFGERFSQQITVLVHHGIQHAHMTVSPPELGPVDVRITLQHDEATVQLASPSVAARDAMQDALPRLRDMLEQAGVRLNDAGVYADLPKQGPNGGTLAQEHAAGGRAGTPAGEAAADEPAGPAASRHAGLIDAYV